MDKTPERRRLKTKCGSSGIWKERFRQGCLNRLKNQRHALINSLRKSNETSSPNSSQETVNKVMLDEWNEFKLFENRPPTPSGQLACSKNHDEDFPDNIEDILDVFDDIEKELIKEEEKLLAQYEDMVNFDDRDLCAAIEMLSTNSVLCPVCKKNNLLRNKQVIFCMCGVRVDTQHDSIDLQFVQQQLNDSLHEHGGSCFHQPDFSVSDLSGVGIKNLIMSCQECDTLSIII